MVHGHVSDEDGPNTGHEWGVVAGQEGGKGRLSRGRVSQEGDYCIKIQVLLSDILRSLQPERCPLLTYSLPSLAS